MAIIASKDGVLSGVLLSNVCPEGIGPDQTCADCGFGLLYCGRFALL
ncbi:hypothetical protein MAXJ12_24327 [Mesorhizobium alhagi CCNWXJ12-2]|uniref:Uncharacterized protein n=1 Tax=Mesorhizobium alhagi CCNWXJ12-2 TaxID=1107882 RepID=H0HXE6_9HYPH|nr:hypothetical protein MAXJ12_24327 [Mesorhizobium alhagi CCNWXJ12-2]